MIISEMVKVVTVLLYNLNYHMDSDGFRWIQMSYLLTSMHAQKNSDSDLTCEIQ
jgi:hypothetical protein